MFGPTPALLPALDPQAVGATSRRTGIPHVIVTKEDGAFCLQGRVSRRARVEVSG